MSGNAMRCNIIYNLLIYRFHLHLATDYENLDVFSPFDCKGSKKNVYVQEKFSFFAIGYIFYYSIED